MAVEIQREIEQADFEHRTIPNVNAEDHRFIRKMLNELSVSAEAKPTAAQGQWLLAIKEWVKAKYTKGADQARLARAAMERQVRARKGVA